jgi:cell division protein FtsI (penicillin-binding protein 3)
MSTDRSHPSGEEASRKQRQRRARLTRTGRARLGLAALMFGLAYSVIGARIVTFAMQAPEGPAYAMGGDLAVSAVRPDITDRNGLILATDVKTSSLFAEPRRIIDVDEAIELLTSVLPDLDTEALRMRLSTDKGFVWIKREITPKQQAEIHSLGLPGIGFRRENRRVYPLGRVAAHVIGHVNIDNRGIAGIEKHLDDKGLADLHGMGFAFDRAQEPVALSLDLRIQHVVRDELAAAMEKFKAKAAAGVVIDIHTGEVIAMASLPDYDPNQPATALDPEAINRMVTGVYEMGSTFKTFTVAMGLDYGTATMEKRYDAANALRVGRFTIDDYRGKNRALSVPEVFIYSSNIGTARMAMEVGIERHQAFLKRFGLLERIQTELPEYGDPKFPKVWKQLNQMTISFGHGISVTPLQMAAASAALVNGGQMIPPTFLKRSSEEARAIATPVLQPRTSEQVRYLMRLNVQKGTATKAEREGYAIGGKTGTAEKVDGGRYAKDKRLTSFLGAFPMDAPRYAILVMLDEPQGLTETHGYATAGWNAAPTSGNIVARIAPMLGVLPSTGTDVPVDPRIASY